ASVAGWPACSTSPSAADPIRATLPAMPTPATPRPTTRKPAPRKKVVKRRARRKPNPYLAWAKRLERTRPGLVDLTLDALASVYGQRPYARRWDPTSELVLTILTQNSADVNAEYAFVELRK